MSSSAHTPSARPFPASTDFVSSDFLALASHMHACRRSQGRWFRLRSALEAAHATCSPRIVTTAAVFAACGLGLLALA